MSAPPVGAAHLCQLGCPFVIDGERLTRDLAGHFVAFDLLELNHNVLTSFSYAVRIKTLEETMLQAGLLVSSRSTPTLASARANSTVDDLSLLVSVAGPEIASRVIADIQASSGEGIVVRRLESDYAESPLKWKDVADLDAFVIDVNPGLAEGSLKFGVLRPKDGAVIEVANVRSGFNDDDIRTVRKMLEKGEHPVFRITYLPIRTVGIQLVEPRSGMAFLRTDKEARQCTTEQFGAEKASDIARANQIESVTLL
jgi:ATP-dependent DNA ligase